MPDCISEKVTIGYLAKYPMVTYEISNGNLPKSPYTTFPSDQFKKKYSMFYDSH